MSQDGPTGVSVAAGASVKVVSVAVNGYDVGIQVADSTANLHSVHVSGCRTATVVAIGASHVRVVGATLAPGGSDDRALDAGVCVAVVNSASGSPRVSLSGALLERCPRVGLALLADQRSHADRGASHVSVRNSVIRGCEQAVQLAHGGSDTRVELRDSALIDNDVRAAWRRSRGAVPQPCPSLTVTPYLCVREHACARRSRFVLGVAVPLRRRERLTCITRHSCSTGRTWFSRTMYLRRPQARLAMVQRLKANPQPTGRRTPPLVCE